MIELFRSLGLPLSLTVVLLFIAIVIYLFATITAVLDAIANCHEEGDLWP